MYELKIRSTKEEMKKVMGSLEELLEKMQCPSRTVMEFIIAFEELIVNIVNYAYGGDTGPIWIKYTFEDCDERFRMIKVILEDEGVEYNPLEKEDPDITLDVKQRKIGGLGIFMAKSLLNEITYQRVNGKNHLFIKKKFKVQQ